MPKYRHDKSLRLPALRRIVQAGIHTRKTTQLDVWLQRLSHFSQFGLFLFTVGALYFTVIPLYQKALLDEAIARKEIELKQANVALEKAYARVRTAAIKEFVFFAGAKCSGLLDRMPASLGQAVSERTSNGDRIFGRDVPACLKDAAKESIPLLELRPEDRNVFDQRIIVLGQESVTLRQHAVREYKEVLSRAAVDPDALPPPGGFSGRLLEIIANRVPPERLLQFKRDAAIKAEQSRIAMTYSDSIRQKIASLKSIVWDRNNLNQ